MATPEATDKAIAIVQTVVVTLPGRVTAQRLQIHDSSQRHRTAIVGSGVRTLGQREVRIAPPHYQPSKATLPVWY